MMQPSQSLMSEDATGGWGPTSTVRCSLPQSKMRAIFVVVANVFREQTFEMLLIHRNSVIQEVSSADSVFLIRRRLEADSILRAARSRITPITLRITGSSGKFELTEPIVFFTGALPILHAV